MTDKQPKGRGPVEALRLAELLEHIDGDEWRVLDLSAAELRRQHDEIKRLHKVNEDLLENLKGLQETVAAAINSGDWVVDGSCDPDAQMLRVEAVLVRATGVTKE